MDQAEIQNFVVQEFIPNILAYVLVVPDLPRNQNSKPVEPFLLSTIKNVLAGARILAKDDQWGLSQIYLKCLQTLSVAAWTTYPYHIGTFSIKSNQKSRNGCRYHIQWRSKYRISLALEC